MELYQGKGVPVALGDSTHKLLLASTTASLFPVLSIHFVLFIKT
uniref:Uncharacterized protein n=1 Tax=Anguilla anguilla TaxID=7936 RepID=A0A0E9Q894_ANGAN